ncbi:hypothetical protein MMC07_001686 [Pseudocyphellaria aurata]|nr:hypothetical protein [Pseudocyphellaria aurata]
MAQYDQDYSDTIFIVKPVGPAATDALMSPANISRLVSVDFRQTLSPVAQSMAQQMAQESDSGSREVTRYCPPPPEIQLHVKFTSLPRCTMQGFVFESDEASCDVVIVGHGAYGISRRHFFVDFC